MPVDRGATRGAHSGGLYEAVRELVEVDARLHNQRVSGWEGGAAQPYPMQRILDALRAGKSTDVPPWAMPQWARAKLAEAARGATTKFGYRAVVYLDDMVVAIADNGSYWLEDHGLNDDFGTPPEIYNQYPTPTKYRGPR
jgi:hypothetical protein